jgi:toluene monooxygenase system protein E
MAQQKTYWHLLPQKRMPTEYEIVTSKLLCYTGEGFTGKRFELDVPLLDWYKRFQQDSPLICSSWENFRDPRETTYTKYTAIQRDKEIFVDGILEEIDSNGYDTRLSPGWLHVLSRVFAPFRYPGHGLQMVASYIGQMAPSGRIVIAATQQAGDELRIESANYKKFIAVSQAIVRCSGRPMRYGSPCAWPSRSCSFATIGLKLSLL